MPQSPIHVVHVDAGARFVDFGGWNMPVQYSGVLDEHESVRTSVGVFDVSHLGRFEVAGDGATELLSRQLCNDIARIGPGRAQYTMALNDGGGVEDDIIVWALDADRYWVMPNGTNSDGILARFRADAPSGVTVDDIRPSTVLFAVQGPDAPRLIESVTGTTPGRFRVSTANFEDVDVTVAGTGYTGEPGGEICASHGIAAALWNALVAAGATPCGLGARDTLRLEMGYSLWGHDLDASTTPLDAGLGWAVSWGHDFVGKPALEQAKEAREKALVAFTTSGRSIPREGYSVTTDTGTGVVTSGNFSPTLQHGIGLAYVSPPPADDESISVSIRGKDIPGTIVQLPFIDR